MLPSDSALSTPSLPWCSLSPQFLQMHPLSLTVIYFSSHCLFPPTTLSPKNSGGHPNEAGLPATHVLGSHTAGGCDGGQFRVRGIPNISTLMRGWHCQTHSPAAPLPLSPPARPLSALLDLSSAFLSLWSQPSPPSALSQLRPGAKGRTPHPLNCRSPVSAAQQSKETALLSAPRPPPRSKPSL